MESLLFIGLLLGFLFMGFPVAFALGLVGFGDGDWLFGG